MDHSTLVNFVYQFGYVGLFIISFLAASIVPLSTEVVVVVMPTLGFNLFWVGMVATAGNYLGALTVYYMGWYGSDFVLSHWITVDPEKQKRAHDWFTQWGAPILLMTWMPFFGEPLCAVAGMLKVSFPVFSFWTFLGKGARYVVLLGAVYFYGVGGS